MSEVPLYAFGHHPEVFSARSGMFPLADALDAKKIYYPIAWESLQKKSWRAGDLLQRWGNSYFGTQWNAVIPLWDELRLSKGQRETPHINLFLWGEFFTPRLRSLYQGQGILNVGCFHATAWRQTQVLPNFKNFDFYDYIVVMSATQRDFILNMGYPEERLKVILHGVDTTHYCPDLEYDRPSEGPIQCIMVGGTERDHQFLACLLKALPEGLVEVKAAIPKAQQVNYEGAPSIEFLPRLSDSEFVTMYQQAELLLLPMNDCTANNTVMEAMACGTPVMSNAVGGIPEYVSTEHCFIMPTKEVEAWSRQLEGIAQQRADLHQRRAAVRTWAEGFAWEEVAGQFKSLFSDFYKANG